MTTKTTHARYLEATQEAGRNLIMRKIAGNVLMLNLLRFREVAGYSANPERAPRMPISGADAYERYMVHTLPHLEKSGGALLFMGGGGRFLIGPDDEHWDRAMLVCQKSIAAFMAFAAGEAYLGGLGHRTAALEDSRLLPLTELPVHYCATTETP